MAKLTDDLVKIARAGGGMYIDASKRLTDDLVKIARAASTSDARIIMTNASKKLTDDLVKIARAGQGCVVFDFGS